VICVTEPTTPHAQGIERLPKFSQLEPTRIIAVVYRLSCFTVVQDEVRSHAVVVERELHVDSIPEPSTSTRLPIWHNTALVLYEAVPLRVRKDNQLSLEVREMCLLLLVLRQHIVLDPVQSLNS